MTNTVPFTISLTAPLTAWTPTQWNTAWQAKVDASNGQLDGLVNVTGTAKFTANKIWAGTDLSQALLNAGAVGLSYVGTMGAVAQNVGLAANFNLNTTMDAHANTGDVAIANYVGNYYQGAQGGMSGIIGTVVIPAGQTLSDTVPREFSAGRDFIIAASASNSQPHALIGRTIAVYMLAAASSYGSAIGQEIAMAVEAGAAPSIKALQYLMLYSSDAARGSSSDRMLGFWSQNAQSGTNNAKVIIDIGPQGESGLYWPGGTDAVVIQASKGASDGSLTVDSLIDFDAIDTVSSYIFKAKNWAVTGAGKMRVGASGAPTVNSGSGAPGATEPIGSVYLRTDGSTNTRFYISAGGGTWSPAITSFAALDLSGLPTSDPGSGKPWLNGGMLQVGP